MTPEVRPGDCSPPEPEIKRIEPRPEDILFPDEAELIQRAGRGELPCLTCGRPLQAEKVVGEWYVGVSCCSARMAGVDILSFSERSVGREIQSCEGRQLRSTG